MGVCAPTSPNDQLESLKKYKLIISVFVYKVEGRSFVSCCLPTIGPVFLHPRATCKNNLFLFVCIKQKGDGCGLVLQVEPERYGGVGARSPGTLCSPEVRVHLPVHPLPLTLWGYFGEWES